MLLLHYPLPVARYRAQANDPVFEIMSIDFDADVNSFAVQPGKAELGQRNLRGT